MAEAKKKKTARGAVTASNKRETEMKKTRTRAKNHEEEPEKKTASKKRETVTSSRNAGGKKETVHAVEENPRNKRFFHQVTPYFLLVLALFSVICFLLIDVFPGVKDEYGVGLLGRYVRNFFCGVFGFGAFFVPMILAVLAFTWNRAVEKDCLLAKNLYALFSIVSLSTLMHVIYATVAQGSFETTVHLTFGQRIVSLYDAGVMLRGGGVIGGLLGELCRVGLGLTGSIIVTVSFTLIFCIFLLGFTPSYVVTSIRYRMKIASEKRAEAHALRREEKAAEIEAAKREKEERRLAEQKAQALKAAADEAERERLALEAEEKRAKRLALEEANRKAEEQVEETKPSLLELRASEPNEDTVQMAPVKAAEPQERPKAETEFLPTEQEGNYQSAKELGIEKELNANDEEFSLQEIFADNGKDKAVKKAPTANEPMASEMDVALLAQMKPISDVEEISEGVEDDIVEIPPELPVEENEAKYEFPPIELLAPDNSRKDEDNSKELRENAQKLMDTLSSFNVRIKDITYSRGPTITRYELKPDAGIRVRSIANLVDDIALSLATTGVRIEAPIPNKPAVGIEVPNQNPATVYLRSLIETEKFSAESSRLTACLGADVGGKPMYFNIAKMPHLLIAGATGMGKSVCINSIIVSLLYKATPDEVKLILIDPKKVEFNIYKDIPHLYCPIVSEPTKAAGALASAVAEMERRFELIEEVGVRDIYNYNAVTKDDPDREFMPQMVIIIDELADLMMTAADSVESSICRLAQKARAAGMHIIIGTQRPSVDVITGLIKANVPSRIAFTVASQVDSRTIIDIAGAEKLIGRGDMLFAPVGAAKPMRVQGAFVSEGEVEKIVEFIKANNCAAKYNDDFINRIEEEAAKCAAGKKGATAEGGSDGTATADGLDPKFRAAVEIAVESGKISTSLLQRKLEVGYGRAAKIIDQMEEMGYVSAPEGNKPRRILISKEDFMQMVVNNEIE
ncbi:MAG: DNA translocase FtsK [Ruminococcaceae bacterium]|nr:DNA translocase FtsK [Oscillospiraceae bacterium]